MASTLEATPTSPPNQSTFQALEALQQPKPIDPELKSLRDEWFPHLADGQTITESWGSAYDLFTKAETDRLIAKWTPEADTLNERTAPDGTGWRGCYVKRYAKHARKEVAILHELIDRHLVTAEQIEFLKSNLLIALLKPLDDGSFHATKSKKRPIGKNNRSQQH